MTQASEIQHLENYKRIHKYGFVGIVKEGCAGSDELIERCARTSYAKGTRKVSKTRGLIRYLMRHRHSGPFEFGQVCFHLRLPLFVMRQLVRHRTMSFNEQSGRYSILVDEFFIPEHGQMRKQSETNKQGRGDAIDSETAQKYIDLLNRLNQECYSTYLEVLEELTRELARNALPTSIYTECYLSCNLRNFFHFAGLRCDSHAQQEITDYAIPMTDFVKEMFPLAYEAWEDYHYHAHNLSRLDIKCLLSVLEDQGLNTEKIANVIENAGADKYGFGKREHLELVNWIKNLKTA